MRPEPPPTLIAKPMKITCLFRAPCLRRALAFLALGSCLPAALAAVDPNLPFDSGSTGADGPLTFREIPGGRNQHALAYDPIRQEVVLFGGYNGSSLGDTWVWRGGDWIRLLPVNSPPDRWNFQMVWDGARGEIVLFGGTRSTGRLNDTWTWNGTNWTQKTPPSSPSPREGAAIAYDAARQRVVLFGGSGGGQETWLWDGTTWAQSTPVNRPPSTASSRMAYDAARQECVLFGNYGQTWIWNGTDWSQRGSLDTPPAHNYEALAYDPVRQLVVLFSGSNRSDMWTWNGVNWVQLAPAHLPPARQYGDMVWSDSQQKLVHFGGNIGGGDNYAADTWLWDGTDWTLWSDKTQYFDMTSRPSGTWNFTTIDIPSRVVVRFIKNTGNTPVRWLATDDVTVNGTIDVNGGFGDNNLPPGQAAASGPGGFDGGIGGIAFNSSASNVGSPGQGPAGGAPGTAQQTSPTNLRDGNPGGYAGAYGNAFLQPLVGGSGGGGGSSSDNSDGGNGGGGGGAILISSSRDIMLNGLIRANGGDRQYSGASFGGTGAGGGILLRADRVTGPGSLEAYGGSTGNPNGRIRVEGYARTLTGAQNPPAVVGLPAANGELNQVGTLTIASVAGANVAQPPSGDLLAPDVVFTAAGAVTIVVNGVGIPNGTPVNLRITTSTTVIQPNPQNMVNGTATFNVTVPQGIGTLQASAQFTL